MNCVVNKPTRGSNYLDRIYVSEPCYTNVKVVSPIMKSDHKAVIANCGRALHTLGKRRERRTFRTCSPAQHAIFLDYVSQLKIEVDSERDVQANFDYIYAMMHRLLDQFYPPPATDYSDVY